MPSTMNSLLGREEVTSEELRLLRALHASLVKAESERYASVCHELPSEVNAAWSALDDWYAANRGGL